MHFLVKSCTTCPKTQCICESGVSLPISFKVVLRKWAYNVNHRTKATSNVQFTPANPFPSARRSSVEPGQVPRLPGPLPSISQTTKRGGTPRRCFSDNVNAYEHAPRPVSPRLGCVSTSTAIAVHPLNQQARPRSRQSRIPGHHPRYYRR